MDKMTSDSASCGDFRFVRYDASRRREWDEFTRNSANATFLFMRGYMDYHSDRFRDCSLMAYYKGKLRACLPANIEEEGTLVSHGGLTYGGWIFPRAHFDGNKVQELFEAWIPWCRAEGLRQIVYKPVPWVLSPMPAQEDLYALWRVGFTLRSRLLSSAIFPDNNPGFNMAKRQQLRDASRREDLRAGESSDWPGFHAMLCDCLASRHDAAPVHTLPELELLHSRFPKNIRLFAVTDTDGAMLAGAVIFDTGFTAHTQYMATSPRGRELNALTLLVHTLVCDIFPGRRIFDFGTSNLPDKSLHASLLEQKYSLGGRGAVYETYTLTL